MFTYRYRWLTGVLTLTFLFLSFLPISVPTALLPPNLSLPEFVEPASAQVAPALCATPGRDGVGAPAGIINTYYPGTGTATAGATSISVGTPTAGAPIAAGDLLLVIQMQDAQINSSNTDAYGDNTPGDVPALAAGGTQPTNGASGFTIGTAGNYEYVVATGAVGGGVVSIQGTNGGGLINTYSSAAATATQGQRTYQVIRVPQYSTATLGSATSAYWDGATGTGGIVAYDVAGVLNLTGGIDVNGRGFRGGGGRLLAGAASPNTDYRTLSTLNKNGSKAEGIAGTPRFTIDSTLTLVNNVSEGYPDGSYGRGAPGNAGGGSTDGNPTGNDQNSGAGGGSNGGAGGIGGRSWQSNLPTGGFGGQPFPAATNRLVLGGGGGAGTTNNGSFFPPANDSSTSGLFSSGAAGGGMVMLRTNTVTGTGTINANGASARSVTRDGGGGGGAGGSILVSALTGGLTGLTANANGGNGGSAVFNDPHGPGGGGGGGVVVFSAGITSSELGGIAGVTGIAANPNNGAVAGLGITIPVTLSTIPGANSGAECVPFLTTTKTTSTPNVTNSPTGTIATYTIAVANGANRVTANNVDISDVLPTGFTYDASVAPIINLTSGAVAATRPTTTNPTNGATNPTFTRFTIPGGAIVRITFQVRIDATVPNGTYQNPATATYDDPATGGRTNANYDPASSAGEDVTIGTPSDDVSIVKTLTVPVPPAPLVAGQPIGFQLVVTNKVATPATATVNDTISPLITGVTWSCTITTGTGSCAGGAGNTINDSITLGANAVATYTITGALNAFTAPNNYFSGFLQNTATVTLNVGVDAVPADNTSIVTIDQPHVRLVKRVTALNGAPIATLIDSPTDPNDDPAILWPVNYLQGATAVNNARPGDVVDYTIYYLSDGAGTKDAGTTLICDRVPLENTFVPTAFNSLTPSDGGLPGADSGIALAIGSTTPTAYLSNANDSPDRGRYYVPNDLTAPGACGGNPNGAVTVSITRVPDLPTLPRATAPGTPSTSYGFIRFRARVS